MKSNVALIRAFLFILKNRFIKKSNVYLAGIRLMVDVTIAIYLLLIVGYVIASFLSWLMLSTPIGIILFLQRNRQFCVIG